MKRSFFALLCSGIFLISLSTAFTQSYAQQPPGIGVGPGNQRGVPGNQRGNQRGNQQGQGFLNGLDGGSPQADFDSLIDLIVSTVDADSWMENGTGEGEIQPFPTGVYADAQGTLRFAKTSTATSLAKVLKQAPSKVSGDVRIRSARRYVSLPRLEAAIHERQLRHEALPTEMLTLAGLQRIEYLFVTPNVAGKPGDLVVAGPAGNWQVRPDGKIVSTDEGQPIVRLDDLLTLWRRYGQRRGAPFGVCINPRQTGLARVQKYVQTSNSEPIQPSQRGKWLKGLQQSLGTQDVEFFGIEPSSHVARVLLVADYHMKLIGMGLAEGVDGVNSYLKTVKLGTSGNVPPMTVLRWWFAMQYKPVTTTAARDVFQLQGPGAKVLSENELLAARGQRVHTGQSEDLNKRFADSFSDHFSEICLKYPLYTELRHVFDLSMVLALIEQEGLLARCGWQPTLFTHADWLPLPRMQVPAEVETVVNHRVIRRKHIVAGVSGGVWIDAKKRLTVEAATDKMANLKSASKASEKAVGWWWD